MKIYLSKNGQAIGPYSESEVFSRIREGVINESTPAATDPEGDWKTLSEVLSSGFRQSSDENTGQASISEEVPVIPSDARDDEPKRKSPPPIPSSTASVDAIDLNGKMFWCFYHSLRLTEVSITNRRIEFRDVASGTALNWFAGIAMLIVGAVIVALVFGDPAGFGAIVYYALMSGILCLGGFGGYSAASGYLRSVAKSRRGSATKNPRLSLPIEKVNQFRVNQEAKVFSFVVSENLQYRFRYLDWESIQPLRRALQDLGVAVQKT